MAAALRFTKMQGIGNDYVYVNGFEEQVSDPGALARGISDRHFGVGSDGLVLILPSTVAGADARMRMFNADGSESEMCGNAVRCVGKYVHDAGICARDTVRIPRGSEQTDWEVELGVVIGKPGRKHGKIARKDSYWKIVD